MSYIPNTKEEQLQMLSELGFSGFEELYRVIPEGVRLKRALNLPDGLSEPELISHVSKLAGQNKVYDQVFMGAGCYRHFIPSVVDALSGRGEFVTAYTPYQAELSQGMLQAIFEFQTLIAEITGLEVSNASVYDGATAAGEAVIMTKERNRDLFLVSAAANPAVISTIKAYALPAGLQVELVGIKDGRTELDDLKAKLSGRVCGVYVAQPNYFGLMEEAEVIGELVHGAGARFVAGVNPMSLGLLKSPGEYSADIAVGDGQPLGIPLSFGGPAFGFMATTKKDMRRLPGRIVGQTVDVQGRRAFVLTLQAREQHIRREKASSNICSNQAWCALRSAIYMSAVGKEGFRDISSHCYANAHYLAEELQKIGFARVHPGEFYNEFVTSSPIPQEKLQERLDAQNILGGLKLPDGNILWCATELTGKAEIDGLISHIKEALKK